MTDGEEAEAREGHEEGRQEVTIAEFKAWFAGYCEHISEVPTQAQWERIKQQAFQLGDPWQNHGLGAAAAAQNSCRVNNYALQQTGGVVNG